MNTYKLFSFTSVLLFSLWLGSNLWTPSAVTELQSPRVIYVVYK